MSGSFRRPPARPGPAVRRRPRVRARRVAGRGPTRCRAGCGSGPEPRPGAPCGRRPRGRAGPERTVRGGDGGRGRAGEAAPAGDGDRRGDRSHAFGSVPLCCVAPATPPGLRTA